MVDDLFQRLEREGLLDNTYIFYSSDNGFHISQHRLVTGKNCGYEEDTNVPLIVRGPNIPKGVTKRAVSSHVDLVPTFFDIAGIPLRDDFDGTPLPLTKDSDQGQREVAAIEFWTLWAPPSQGVGKVNNVYKAVRLVGEGYNLYYAVWCTNEHELYDMTVRLYDWLYAELTICRRIPGRWSISSKADSTIKTPKDPPTSG